jgi:hypothetical protein
MSDNEDDFIQINTSTTVKKPAQSKSQDPVRKTLNKTIKKPEKFEKKVKQILI